MIYHLLWPLHETWCGFRPGSLAYRLLLTPLAAIDRRALRKWQRKLTPSA